MEKKLLLFLEYPLSPYIVEPVAAELWTTRYRSRTVATQ